MGRAEAWGSFMRLLLFSTLAASALAVPDALCGPAGCQLFCRQECEQAFSSKKKLDLRFASAAECEGACATFFDAGEYDGNTVKFKIGEGESGGRGAGGGHYDSLMVPVMMPAATVESFLPPGLQLAPQPVAPVGFHPVIMAFGRQVDVHPLVGPPLFDETYWEFIHSVPWTTFTADAKHGASAMPNPGPFIFSPRLYLDSPSMVFLGWLYGLDKELAVGDGDLETFNIVRHTNDTGGEPILSANWSSTGPFAAADSFFSFAPWLDAMENQPLVGLSKWTGIFECSRFNWGLSDGALLAPVEGSFDVYESYAGDMPVGTTEFTAMGDPVSGIWGAWRLQTNWTMSIPVPCASLRSKTKVAILGGGLGSMVAAWHLTQVPDWKEHFDITVHQMGWRLGGKTASGRDTREGYGLRNEEHGLHIFMGFYDNAFRTVREITQARGIDWTTLFLPDSDLTLATPDVVRDTYFRLEFVYPSYRGTPGDVIDAPTIDDLVFNFCKIIQRVIHKAIERVDDGLKDEHVVRAFGRAADLHGQHHSLKSLMNCLKDIEVAAAEATQSASTMDSVEEMKVSVEKLSESIQNPAFESLLLHGLTTTPLPALAQEALSLLSNDGVSPADGSPPGPTPAQFLIVCLQIVDWGVAQFKGMVVDGVLFSGEGFAAINQYEYIEWLLKNGMRRGSEWNPITRGGYDLIFGFKNGDVRHPECAAGVASQGILNMGAGYHGELFYKFQFGTADVLFAPLYQELVSRGVRFEFMHKVTNLGVGVGDAGEPVIDDIAIVQQASLVDSSQEYQPLVDFPTSAGSNTTSPGWPDAPLWAQLVDGEELEASGANLESYYDAYQGVGNITLRRGEDFDVVVLGIPIGAHPYITKELAGASPAWAQHLASGDTVATLALQLWMTPTTEELGFKSKGMETTLTSFRDPFNTWSDMTHILGSEDWVGSAPPASVHYFCGPLRTENVPDLEDHDYPDRETAAVEGMARAWLTRNVEWLWNNTKCPRDDDSGVGTPDPLECFWPLLVDPSNATGPDRLKAQYFR